MAIEVSCQCGAAYRLDESRAGEKFRCKVCGAGIQVPGDRPRVLMGQSGEAAMARPAAPPPPARPGPEGPAASAAPAKSPRPPEQPAANPARPPQPARPVEPAMAAPVASEPTSQQSVTANQKSPVEPVRARTGPPSDWWLLRMVFLAVCVGFLFCPWFLAAYSTPPEGQMVESSLSGWELGINVLRGLHELARNGQFVQGPERVPIDPGMLPEGAGQATAGGLLMLASPVLYLLGVPLAGLMALVAWRRDGRGARWPFVTFAIGVIGFIVGWHLLSAWGPLAEMLLAAQTSGVSFGLSGWVYLMVPILGVMIAVAASRPDHAVEAARLGSAGPHNEN